jgi:hypothetical protein
LRVGRESSTGGEVAGQLRDGLVIVITIPGFQSGVAVPCDVCGDRFQA